MMASTLITKPKIVTGKKLYEMSCMLYTIKTFSASFQKNQKGYLAHYVSVIKMMSPKNILNKGFAIVKYKGEVISNPDIFATGSEMEVILMDKSIKSTVKNKSTHNGNEFDL